MKVEKFESNERYRTMSKVDAEQMCADTIVKIEKHKGIIPAIYGFHDIDNLKQGAEDFPVNLIKAQVKCDADRERSPKTFCTHTLMVCDRRCIEFIEENITSMEWYRGKPIGDLKHEIAWCSRFNMPIKF